MEITGENDVEVQIEEDDELGTVYSVTVPVQRVAPVFTSGDGEGEREVRGARGVRARESARARALGVGRRRASASVASSRLTRVRAAACAQIPRVRVAPGMCTHAPPPRAQLYDSLGIKLSWDAPDED